MSHQRAANKASCLPRWSFVFAKLNLRFARLKLRVCWLEASCLPSWSSVFAGLKLCACLVEASCLLGWNFGLAGLKLRVCRVEASCLPGWSFVFARLMLRVCHVSHVSHVSPACHMWHVKKMVSQDIAFLPEDPFGQQIGEMGYSTQTVWLPTICRLTF